MRRRLGAALAAALVAVLLAGCGAPTPPNGTAAPVAAARAGIALTKALGSLPKASTQPRPTRLAKGLTPPTNRWFSGLVFGPKAQSVFPLPLTFTPKTHGFRIGLPAVTATADTIFGSAAPGLGLQVPGAAMRVVRYDALTVTARWGAAEVTLAQGWPYVAVQARGTLTATFTDPVTAADGGIMIATVGGVRYAVRAPDGAISGNRLRLLTGQRAVLFALPDGVTAAAMVTGSRGVVTGGSVQSAVGASTATTRLSYRTAGGTPTLLAALPHQQQGGAHCADGTIPSVDGPLSVCTGTSLRFSVPRTRASDSISLAGASASARAAVTKQLRRDVRATPTEPADTYGGGKWLYRLANLLQVAKAVHDPKSAAAVRAKLDAALLAWTKRGACPVGATHCFVVDPVIHGVVGREASYGSDQFNDHHFHYGYFLSAAAIAVADRPALKAKLAPVVNLLAADIASPTASSALPAHRTFDAYAGHSWAAGYAPFADGNDEESSSEAVNAWNGLTLWAEATGDTALANEGTWLLSTEIATARSDWLYPTLTSFPGYDHAFVSLNWGGKRDSATWFSADPAAKLGIQLIPMSPVSGYTKASAAKMAANLKEAKSARTGLFADYLLMYARLGGLSRASALHQLRAIPTASIDTANSRAYTMAWIMTR